MKKSPLNDAKWANRDPGTNMTQKEKLQNRNMYKSRTSLGNTMLNIGKSYLDWNDDGKITASDIGKEAASWMVGGPVAKGLLRGGGKVVKFLKGAFNRESSSPFNHCDSEMMHSGGWGEVRKYNSPGTTGNKEAIKHNRQIMSKIGTFNMPHSPLNKGHEIKQDSLGKDEAWAQWEKGYMDRTHKFKGTKFEKPITAEENRKEMEMERNEFMYDPKIGRIRLRKTDDADIPIERKSSMENPFKINRRHDIEKAPDRPMADIQKTYDDNIDYAKNKLSGDKLKSYIEEEDAMLKDWISRKAKDAAASPFNKKSRCWEGYEPTPGVKAYEPGSCRKK